MERNIFTLLVCCLLLGGLHAQNIEIPQTNHPLVMKHSATWCPPCGGTAWTTYEDLLQKHEGQAVFMQVHPSHSSLFYSPNARDLLDNCNLSFAQPEFFYNTTRIGGGSAADGATISSNISAKVNAAPSAQTGIAVFFDRNNRLLEVETNTRFFKDMDGAFYLSVFLVIKDTVAFQQARGPNELHKHVLKQALTDETFGKRILNGSISTGTEQSYDLTTALPADMTPAQVEIVTVLWQETEGGFDFINANVTAKLSERTITSREELAQLDAGLVVAPNIVRNHFDIRLDLDRDYNSANLTLFNLLGQPVHQLFQGRLLRGNNQFEYERTFDLPSGIYLLRLRAGNIIITRRLLFQ